jgi:hypothetical protein
MSVLIAKKTADKAIFKPGEINKDDVGCCHAIFSPRTELFKNPMDKLTIKTPKLNVVFTGVEFIDWRYRSRLANPWGFSILQRDFAAGVYLSEAPVPSRFLFGVV